MPGSLVWNQSVDKDKIFVKCAAETWVYFNKMALSPFGNKTASELIKVLFQAPAAKPIKTKNGIELKFNFI